MREYVEWNREAKNEYGIGLTMEGKLRVYHSPYGIVSCLYDIYPNGDTRTTLSFIYRRIVYYRQWEPGLSQNQSTRAIKKFVLDVVADNPT